MAKISRAQNFEDVYLSRAFPGQTQGFYIDVGAWHPEQDSVTKYFYDLGWTGINVEPSEEYYTLLSSARPRDINLNVGLGQKEGNATLYARVGSGISSFVPDYGSDTSQTDAKLKTREVQIMTLRQICEQHVTQPIDFLKIDVEGLERDVILGGDWKRFRPRVVVIEATRPNSREPAWDAWEPLLLEQGYIFAFFDCLNRYYVRQEEKTLLQYFGDPVNIWDGFIYLRFEPTSKESAETVTLEDLKLANLNLRYQVEALNREITEVYRTRASKLYSLLRWIWRKLR